MAKKPDPELENWEALAEGVNPDAAIKFWQERAKLTWDEAKELADGAKARAFYVTGLAQQDLVKLVSDGLEEALKNGETLPQFRERILKAIEEKGWKEYRVETIFRTNMQTAYSAGRYLKMQAVKKTRPYWQYMAVMDKRTRPSHAILNGLVYPADHEFWNSNYPPNGFRCRCGVITLSDRQVSEQGLTVEKEMPQPGVWTDPKTNMEYFVHFPGADKGFANNPFKDWAKNGGIEDLPGLSGFTPVKQAPVTQKMLQSQIADIEAQIQNATDASKKAKLQAKKEAYQKVLEKKAAKALKDKLTNQNKKFQEQLDKFQIKTYSGIWQQDVTTKDWAQKAASIQSKKDYFLSKLANGGLTAEEVAKFQGYLKDLDEFSAKGQEYYNLQKKLQDNHASLEALKKGGKKAGKTGPEEDANAFSQERKDKALWAKHTAEADAQVRAESGKIWKGSTKAEKRAIYDYTEKSGKFNRPLSGYQKPFHEYSPVDGWEPKFFKGLKQVWLDYEEAGDRIRLMTEMISRSKYNFDMMLQRGCDHNAIESYFGLEFGSLKKMTTKNLQKFVGVEFRNYSFTSTAVCEGKGFSHKPVIMKIYAPRGTQMMYAEPFSHYGHGDKLAWDGEKGQTSFGTEAEMIIQRGAKFRVTSIEKKGAKIYIEVEVHPEAGYDLFQQDPAEWKGSKEKFK